MSKTPRTEYLLAGAWCAWQLGVMLLRLNLRQAARHVVCIFRSLWWAVTGGPE